MSSNVDFTARKARFTEVRSDDVYTQNLSVLQISNVNNITTDNITTDNITTDTLTTNTANATSLVSTSITSDNILGTTGFNYLSPWSATKSYIVGDLVISNNQIWRALLANTNIVPDPNNPAQTQWVPLTNNSATSDRQFVLINSTTGNDTKALTTAVPFATPKAAINFLNANGGGTARITTTTATEYLWPSGGIEINNVTLDGGDVSQSPLNNPTNTLRGYFVFNDSINTTLKNISIVNNTGLAGELIRLQGVRNFSLENVTFPDPPNPLANNIITVVSNASNNFGNTSMTNCYVNPDNNDNIAVNFGGTCDPSTRLIFDNASLSLLSRISISTTGITNPQDVTLICRNTSVTVTNCTHFTGSNFLFVNCVIIGTMTSAASSGTVAFYNCTFYDPVAAVWGGLNFNMTGTATYQLVDCLLNPNSTLALTSVSTASYNLTSGPAARYNRQALLGAGASVSLTSATQIQMPLGAISSNPFSIVSLGGGANTIRFLVAGTYNVNLTLLSDNTATGTDATTVNVWIGISGATEATSLARSSYVRRLTSAGNLAGFPSSTNLITLPITILSTQLTTDMFIYSRNLGATALNSNIVLLEVTQVR